MKSLLSTARGTRALMEANRRFYDVLWTDARLVEPERLLRAETTTPEMLRKER